MPTQSPRRSDASSAGPSSGRRSRDDASYALCHLYDDPVKTKHREEESRQTVRRLSIALALCLVLMTGEIIGGVISGSVAVLSDAAHMLADAVGLGLSLVSAIYSRRPGGKAYTFGFHRAQIVGAFGSIFVLYIVTAVLVREAIGRVIHPTQIDGKIMFIMAALGVLNNFVLFAVLGGHDPHHMDHDHDHHDHGHSHGGHGHSKKPQCPHHSQQAPENDLEAPLSGAHAHDSDSDDDDHHHHHGHGHGSMALRAALVHVLGDSVQSVGVLIAAGVVWWAQAHRPGDLRWNLADPIATFLFTILVVASSSHILRDLVDLVMERAPRDLSAEDVVFALEGVEGVAGVHDIHLWNLAPGIPICTAHIEVRETAAGTSTSGGGKGGAGGAASNARYDEVIKRCDRVLRRLGVDHSTLQPEPCYEELEPLEGLQLEAAVVVA